MTATAPCDACGRPAPFGRIGDGTLGTLPHDCRRTPVKAAGVAPGTPTPRLSPALIDGAPLAFAPAARRHGGELTLWLPREPAAAEGPNGRSWRAKSRATKVWHALVRAALEALPQAPPTWPRVTLAYRVYRRPGRHEHDRDNLVVALGKPVQDALVAAGVMPGDGPDVVVATPAIEQELSPLPWGFVVVEVRRA